MILGAGRVRFGGDYNPEQHPESSWAEDIRLMRSAGIDLVNVAVFGWSWIEPTDGAFDFSGLDRILAMLSDADIGVGLGTATASPPPWLTTAHPEILPRDADGVTLAPGSRQHFAPSSPVYRAHAGRLVDALARRYASHPAVEFWHVNNEYGCHVSLDHSAAATTAFRGWLRRRYATIDELNAAWGTRFWSQQYGSFDEIHTPARAAHVANPGQDLDFRRFSSDMLLECFLLEKDVLRANGAGQPITTNLIGPFPTIDLWRWAPHLDIVSDDCYPDPDDPEGYREAALHGDLARSLAHGGHWLRMEASPDPGGWRSSPVPSAPGRARAQAWQAVGRGADGIQFFQFRQSSAGAERFHPGMVPHAGADTRVWREMVGLGRELSVTQPPPESASGARVALVFDIEDWWAIEGPDLPARIDYSAHFQRWYRALHRRHVTVDLVRAGTDLDAYALVIAPHLYMLSDAAAAEFTRFADAGGVLAVGPLSDVADSSARVRPGGALSGLGATLGVRVAEHAGLAVRGDAGRSVGIDCGAERFQGTTVVEPVEPGPGTQVRAVYADGRYPGAAAITRHPSGSGSAWYVGTVLDVAGTSLVLERLLADAGVRSEIEGLPASVEVARRGSTLTVINHEAGVEVDLTGFVDLAGDSLGVIRLEPLEVVRVRRGD